MPENKPKRQVSDWVAVGIAWVAGSIVTLVAMRLILGRWPWG